MNYPIIVIILGMAVVTYLPRMLPSVVMDKVTISPKVEKFLRMIPYTAMAALIFPGVLTVDATHPVIGLLGGVVAGALAWKRVPVILCVAAAIVTDMVLYTVVLP